MNNTEYFSIAESIKAEILAGVYASKGKLPSKTEFAQKYGVSKSTIQNSLEILKREGYIVSIPKSGIYVKGKSNSTYCLSEPEDEQTARWHRMLWAVVLMVFAFGMLMGNSLQAVQISALLAGFPLIPIAVTIMASLKKMLREDIK